MLRIIVVLYAAAVLCGVATAQVLTASEISDIDAIFSEFAQPDSPGCALGIYRDDAIVYAHGYGMASLELGVPITPQTVFDIGSTSKQFTAFSILLLQQRGKLSVDDDIRKFLPEIPNYGKKITLRHLMTHTSGIRDYAGLFDLAGIPEQNLTNDQDAVNMIVRQKALNFMPGEEWDYSNSGFFLLSQVVRRVTGKTLRDFEQENIFVPLGMGNTQIFNDHTQVIPHRATGYSYDGDRKQFGVEMSNFEQTGDGSIQTSVEDLLRWDQNFYSAKLGGADLIRQMQIVGRLNSGKEHGYAAGLMISNYRGQPVVSHGGAWAGYRAELMRFPLQHASVAVLCNLAQAGPTARAYQVADVLLAKVLEPKTEPANDGLVASIAGDVLQKYAGVYKSERDEYQHVEFKEGKLWLADDGLELVPRSANVFRTKIGNLGSISFSDKAMTIVPLGEKAQKYVLLPAYEARDLSPFAGDYYSPELDATWQLRIQDGQLKAQMKHSDVPALTLRAVSKDTFTVEGGSLRFELRKGRAARALLTISRIRNVEFIRN